MQTNVLGPWHDGLSVLYDHLLYCYEHENHGCVHVSGYWVEMFFSLLRTLNHHHENLGREFYSLGLSESK